MKLITKKKENDEKHQKFVEFRKKSIKNEFSIVKELIKKQKFDRRGRFR